MRLRKVRIILAAVCFALVTLLFLDFTGTLHAWFGWLAKVQFLPAVLALNAGVVVALLVLTLLFGRVYCSVICPLGVMQDIFGWFGRRQKKNRYAYSPALSWLRYGMLAVFLVALVAGAGSLAARLTVLTGVSLPIFSPRFTGGGITCWLTLPNVWTVTLFIRRKCG